MTEYIDKTEAMRRFKPFGREIPKEQVMAVLARIDEGIVRCKDCKYYTEWKNGTGNNIMVCGRYYGMAHNLRPNDFCSYGERSDE